jgi:hypothetical protein
MDRYCVRFISFRKSGTEQGDLGSAIPIQQACIHGMVWDGMVWNGMGWGGMEMYCGTMA